MKQRHASSSSPSCTASRLVHTHSLHMTIFDPRATCATFAALC